MATFAEELTGLLDADQLRDLAEHGASAGWPGLTYYSDTVAMYERHRDEVWSAVAADADDMGYSPLVFIGMLGGAEGVEDHDTLANLLTWYMAERTARVLTEED